MSILDRIIAYESGSLTYEQVRELFEDLIRTGMLWNLQGSYQRAAKAMGLI